MFRPAIIGLIPVTEGGMETWLNTEQIVKIKDNGERDGKKRTLIVTTKGDVYISETLAEVFDMLKPPGEGEPDGAKKGE